MRPGFVKTLIFALGLAGATFALMPAAHAVGHCSPPAQGYAEAVILDFASYYKVDDVIYFKELPDRCDGSGSDNFLMARLISTVKHGITIRKPNPQQLANLLRASQSLSFTGSRSDRQLNTARDYAVMQATTYLKNLVKIPEYANSGMIAAALDVLEGPGSGGNVAVTGSNVLGGAKKVFEAQHSNGSGQLTGGPSAPGSTPQGVPAGLGQRI